LAISRVDNILAKLDVLEEPDARLGEGFGFVSRQKMTPGLQVQALGADRCRYNRDSMGESFENLHARAAAVPQGHGYEIGPLQFWLHRRYASGDRDRRWIVQAYHRSVWVTYEPDLH